MATFKLLIYSWFIMLAAGGVHHDADPRIPAIGYVTTLFIVGSVALAADVFRQDTEK